MEHLIHKVNITEEAKFDIECLNASTHFNKNEVKEELEYFITKNKKYHNKWYYKIFDFLDALEIIYFIKKGEKFSNMQIWNVVGICEVCDFNEEMEECGVIRGWYETKLEPNKNERDWVEELRERQIIEEREKIKDDEERNYYERLFSS